MQRVTRQHAATALGAAIIAAVAACLFLLLYDRQSAPAIVVEDAPAEREIVVAVSGAVRSPGVYRLPGDSRMNDVIAAAGGFADEADLSGINLAARLADEQQIVVPARGSTANGSPVAEPAKNVAPGAGMIDINTADASLLDTLPGIGPVLAGRIVQYREAHGPFARVEELARVEGISPSMVDELRDRITVGS